MTLFFDSLPELARAVGLPVDCKRLCFWKREKRLAYEAQRGVPGVRISADEFERLRRAAKALAELKELGFAYGQSTG